MNTYLRISLSLSVLAGMTLAACATSSPHPDKTPEAQIEPVKTIGPEKVIFEMPGVPGPGPVREPRVRLQTPALKIATIVLRQGTVLPEHDAPVPVTIVALSGAGVVTVGNERLPIDATRAVYLAPKVSHAVIPEPGTDLVLLVHHLGAAEEKH